MNAQAGASEPMALAGTAAVRFTLDGREVDASPGETLLHVATRLGTAIPHLCHKEGLEAVGNCRACMVEIEGERVLAPSCCRVAAPGLVVASASPRAVVAQKMVLELLLADMPAVDYVSDSELDRWAAKM